MKKLVALFLTAAMMLCALPAFATEINWADLQEQGAETIAKGEFVTFDEISIKMWMPTVLAAVELTDEDIEQAMGVIAPGIEKQATESFKNNGFMFTVNESAQRMRATQWLLDNTKVEYED